MFCLLLRDIKTNIIYYRVSFEVEHDVGVDDETQNKKCIAFLCTNEMQMQTLNACEEILPVFSPIFLKHVIFSSIA